MAPRPRNTQPPVPPTTVPPQSALDAYRNSRRAGTTPTPTPTPTTIPTPTTVKTTVPSALDTFRGSRRLGAALPGTSKVGPIQVPRALSTTPDVLEANKALRDQTREAIKAGVPTTKIQEIVTGESPKEDKLEKVFNFDIIPGPWTFRPIKTVVAPALGGLATGGRFVISANEEAIDFFKSLGREPQKYTRTDYIPVHPQTGLPIAKTGDYVIRNWSDVINTPIPGIENIKTPEEAQAAQDKLVKSTARTTAPSFSDLKKATKDFTYSASDSPYIPETGNAIIDGIIDFSYDVILDPVTYATLGGSAYVKPVTAGVAKGATKASAAAAARETARAVAAEAAATAARVAADPLATVAQKTAAQAAADAAEKAAEKAFTKAAAAAPRRVYGRTAREALANNVASAKIAAQQILDDAASTAGQKAVAQQALKVLTDDFIQEVAAKGYAAIRGEAARTLGVRSGARIGLPFGPKVTIPFTAKLTDFFGTQLAGTRFFVFKSELGQRMLNKITPPGEGGLFGSADILNMRTALRTKSVPAEVAADYVQLLAADTRYRGILDLRRKFAGAEVRRLTSGKNRQILQDISQHLSTPESSWASVGLRDLTVPERKLYDRVRTTLDKFYAEANGVAGQLGAGPLPKLPDYFPRVQSEQAVEWASKNAEAAAKAASDLGVNRTFFLGNFTPRSLEKGRNWFGNILNGTETTAQLNDLARPTLGFDFFETDPVKALAAYAANHARYYAYGDTLLRMSKASPSTAGGLAQDLKGLPTTVKTGAKPTAMELGTVESTIARLMNPDRLQLWNKADVDAIRTDIAALQSKLAGAAPIDREAFQEALLELDDKINATNRLIDAGAIDPTMGSLLRTEIEDYANALALAINNTRREFLVTSPSRWQSVQRAILDGFTVLNEKTVPDIAVRNQILEMFTNVKRLDDPAFVRAAENALQDYTTFFKSYATLTPGFHLRNSIGNLFMMIAAGANPVNLTKGARIYRKWLKAQKAGKDVIQFVAELRKAKLVTDLDELTNITQALSYAGATGFGQFGEISSAAGLGRPGVFGREATGRLPVVSRIPGLKDTFVAKEIPGARTLSQVAGAPIYGSRKLGEMIEGFNRFQLTYDGLMQGYDAATAAARTQKYLIDYQDLSTADRALRQIIPFWTWASRNVPLQIENMWLNPKAYVTYNKLRQNLRDEENESPFLRQYRREAGAFKLPETGTIRIPGTRYLPGRGETDIGIGIGPDAYLQPDLGFPGAGQPSLLEEAFASPERLLSRLTPGARVPLELWKNKQFFSGAPVTNEKSANANMDRMLYGLRQVGAPISLLARYANMTPLRRYEFLQKIAGTQKVSDEQEARNQELNAAFSFFGAPWFRQLPSDERKEIFRRFFELLDETEKAKYQKKEKEKK